MRSLLVAIVSVSSLTLLSQSARAWNLVQVGPQERSLEIADYRGACESVSLAAAQTPAAVSITITRTPFGEGPCILIAFIDDYTVHLAGPLAGRHIHGAARPSVDSGPLTPEVDGVRHRAVPRLIGLSPADARFMLAGLGLHAEVRVIGATAGLPRVSSQFPVAGTRDPTNRVVRVDVKR